MMFQFAFTAHDPPTSMFNYRTDPEGMLHGHNKLARLTHYRIPHFSVPRSSRPPPRAGWIFFVVPRCKSKILMDFHGHFAYGTVLHNHFTRGRVLHDHFTQEMSPNRVRGRCPGAPEGPKIETVFRFTHKRAELAVGTPHNHPHITPRDTDGTTHLGRRGVVEKIMRVVGASCCSCCLLLAAGWLWSNSILQYIVREGYW